MSNPLLLTLTASLSACHLPDDRADLFNEIVELLLKRWTTRSGADRSLREEVGREIRHEDIRQKIEDCAFAAHRGHVGQAGVADISEAALKAAFASLLGGSDDRAKIVIEFVERRAGLLLSKGRKAGSRQFSCPHRAFQEFLAGCHLSAKESFTSTATSVTGEETPSAVALAREHPGHWREVLSFAARQARAERGSLAAHNLVHNQSFKEWSEHNQPTETDWRCAVVAGRQLLEIGLVPLRSTEATRLRLAHVAGWLGALLEQDGLGSVRERLEVSFDLARLGDPRDGVGLKQGVPDIVFEELQFPAGEFALAGNRRKVRIEQPYRLSRYAVTVAQYQAFVDAKGYEQDPLWLPKGRAWRDGRAALNDLPVWYRDEYRKLDFPIRGPQDYDPVFQTLNHPRVGVSWYEATAFCRWLTKQLQGRDALPRVPGIGAERQLGPTEWEVRLPHEGEWEQAARWNVKEKKVDGRYFPWGGSKDAPDLAQRCNMAKTGIGHTSAVGLFPSGAADCGALDMSGNVWEWCENLYQKDKPWRVLRGGSWSFDLPEGLSCSFRSLDPPDIRYYLIGFRCVMVGMSSARG